MRARWFLIWLTVSVVLNAVLLAAWLTALRPPPSTPPVVIRPAAVTNLLRPIRTNVLFQPRLLTWKDVESEDYPTYVQNLRGIGCPADTVRDIIVADVNALFARRRRGEVPHPSHQWWRLEPDPDLAGQIAAKTAELELERRNLLTTLLGAGWELGDPSSALERNGTDLGGPVLGELSEETRRQVRAIERLGRERGEALVQSREEGATVTAAEAAEIERELRARLAGVLNAEQLEEYLLRHSLTAQSLRTRLKGVEVTPEEFRSLFQALDAIESERSGLAGTTAPLAQKRLAELEQKEQAAIERGLGAARYVRLRLGQDAVFRETWTAAERAGVAAEHVIPLYQVNQVALDERRRVLADASLAPEEQARLLAELYAQRLLALRALVGEEAFQRLQALDPPAP